MLSLLFILFIALVTPGVIARTRALLSGRRGVRIFQHIDNAGVMFRKGAVYSSVSGFVTRLAPPVYLAAAVTAMLCVPVGGLPAVFSFEGDVILFCYMLALGRTMLILAAMDTGGAFEGMGASREALYGALVEPGLFVMLGTLAMASGNTSFSGIFYGMDGVFAGAGAAAAGHGAAAAGGYAAGTAAEISVAMLLVGYCFFRTVLVEAGRLPVDDPHTHLELTMIHEAEILDFCGFDLGLITVAGWIKTAVLAVLGASAIASVLSYDAITVTIIALLFAVAIGVMESFIARNRLARNPTYIITTIAVATLGCMIAFMIKQGIHV